MSYLYNNNKRNWASNYNAQQNRGGISYDHQRARRPKSGAQMHFGKDNARCLTGWKIDKRHQFISFKAYPISESGMKKINSQRSKFGKEKLPFEARTKGGAVRERWFAKVKIGFEFKRMNCFYDAQSGKLYFPTLNMVASHKGNYQLNKGYFGRISKRR